MTADALFAQALDLHRRGALGEAEALYRKVVDSAPASFDAQHMLGVVLHQTGRDVEAVALLQRALGMRDDAAARSNLGIALRKLGRLEEALAAFDRAVTLRPQFVQAHNNRGNVLRDLGRSEESLASYRRALELDPDHLSSLRNRADALHALGRYDEAIVAFDRLLALSPGDGAAWQARGKVMALAERLAEAVASFDAALRIAPDDVDALEARASVLVALLRPGEALASAQRALALQPAREGALRSSAAALALLERHEDALDVLRHATRAFPDSAEVQFDLGAGLLAARRYAEAAEVFAAFVARWPDYPLALGQLLHSRMQCCDWTAFEELRDEVLAQVRSGRLVVEPFAFQAIAELASDARICAVTYAAAHVPLTSHEPPRIAALDGRRIRVGYVCGEFREQATSILMAEVYERHDRTRFEVIAFDNGFDDGSAMRSRLVRAFDRHVDISRLDDDSSAGAIRALGVDVLVNLNGFYGRHRFGVFKCRPAPIQVNYLGFPGTLGHPCMDYLIADRHVIPPDDEAFYVERIVRLPGCYQPNDSRRPVAEREPARAAVGLPEHAFVFCCFNNNYKLVPAMFSLWMRMLQRHSGSVLWLLEDNAAAAANLRRAAAARGVDPVRIVFAPRCSPPEHLARHRLADLFLDTLPYNAHTTASDALWAGLPVLTCQGDAFPGRVAASLLRTLGLDDLVTRSLDEYAARAGELCAEPARLEALRRDLLARRSVSDLFDGAACCRHLESAYATMASRAARGEAPAAFDIEGPDRS